MKNNNYIFIFIKSSKFCNIIRMIKKHFCYL